MAISVAIRLAIRFGPPATLSVYRYVSSGGSTGTQGVQTAIANFLHRLRDRNISATLLSSELSAAAGEEVIVTDFTGTFELRKLQWRLSRTPSGGTIEDQDVMTFHFIKTSSGAPAAWVDGTDLPALETKFNTYWGSIKGNYMSWVHSDQFRWYKDGPEFYELRETPPPAIYVPLAAGNPAVRVTEVDVAGTAGDSYQTPPQTAMTVTERTSSRIHWGRWYLPAPDYNSLSPVGRIASSQLTSYLTAAVTLYNSCRASSYIPVVWSVQKPERTKKNGATLPAQDATAFEVTSLQMDDLFDVVRRRRYGTATIKTNTVLT